MQKRRQSGFTLLEVMVVIVILGILASLVVPNLMGNKEKADQQKAVSDIVALENALDMYKLDNNRYPTTEQGLDALVNKPTAAPEPRSYREGATSSACRRILGQPVPDAEPGPVRQDRHLLHGAGWRSRYR